MEDVLEVMIGDELTANEVETLKPYFNAQGLAFGVESWMGRRADFWTHKRVKYNDEGVPQFPSVEIYGENFIDLGLDHLVTKGAVTLLVGRIDEKEKPIFPDIQRALRSAARDWLKESRKDHNHPSYASAHKIAVFDKKGPGRVYASAANLPLPSTKVINRRGLIPISEGLQLAYSGAPQ